MTKQRCQTSQREKFLNVRTHFKWNTAREFRLIELRNKRFNSLINALLPNFTTNLCQTKSWMLLHSLCTVLKLFIDRRLSLNLFSSFLFVFIVLLFVDFCRIFLIVATICMYNSLLLPMVVLTFLWPLLLCFTWFLSQQTNINK